MGEEREEFYAGRVVVYKGALGVRVLTKIMAIDDYDGLLGILSYNHGWTSEQMLEEFGMQLKEGQRVLWVSTDDVDFDVTNFDFEIKR